MQGVQFSKLVDPVSSINDRMREMERFKARELTGGYTVQIGGRWFRNKGMSSSENRLGYGMQMEEFDPEAERQAALEKEREYQERMSYLRVAKDWYSMKEEERIKIGKELFPLEKISELPTREEFQTLKGSSEMINDSPTYVPQSYFDYRKSKEGGELRSVVPKFTEIEKLTGAEKFREFAYKEQYFERNDQLNYFAGEVVRSNEEAQRKLRPEVIQEAKDQAIQQREEMGMVGSARKTRTPLKKTPLQISSNPLENEIVNIPT